MTDQFRPSLLTSLLDDQPRSSLDDHKESIGKARVIGELVRDLESLLNSRMRGDSFDPPAGPDILAYGLPDFGVALERQTKQSGPEAFGHVHRICRNVAAAIEQFEPRLRHVTVEPEELFNDRDRKLRLRITAEMALPPYDPVSWTTERDVGTGQIVVSSSG